MGWKDLMKNVTDKRIFSCPKRQGIISCRYARRCIVFGSGRVSRQVNILCFCVCETKNSEIPCAPS